MVISTLNNLDVDFETIDLDVDFETIDIVSSSVVKGVGVTGDFFAKIIDTFGGRSKAYIELLESSKKEVTESIIQKAKSLGADMILGYSINIETLPLSKDGLLIINAVGTAVRIKKKP